MADKLSAVPAKGILKSSSSFDQPEAKKQPSAKETKWDEMNILQTLHPPDKDYGHMKIEEPKTPYNYANPSEDEIDTLDTDLLAKKINAEGFEGPTVILENKFEDSDEPMYSIEEQSRRDSFEYKRKLHYNEFSAVQLARKLMETDEEDEDDDESINENSEMSNAASTSDE